MIKAKPIYSFPDIKEPEKTSAWKEKDRAEPKIDLVDHELLDDEKRTKLIKEKMSPEGALHLPPLLDKHRLKYGIPDAFFKSQAAFDRIYIFPLDPDDETERVKGTVLYKPKATKLRDKQEGNRGVLISAGLTAADRLMSHGIELGHVVTTNKNVPFARRCEEILGVPMFFLVMRDGDLAGSETLAEEILEGKKRVVEVRDESGYEHQIAGNDNGEWVARKKKSTYIADNW